MLVHFGMLSQKTGLNVAGAQGPRKELTKNLTKKRDRDESSDINSVTNPPNPKNPEQRVVDDKETGTNARSNLH